MEDKVLIPWVETWIRVDPDKVTPGDDPNLGFFFGEDDDQETDVDSWEDGIDPGWNPMAEDYRSLQNLIGVDAETPLSFKLGVKGLKETLAAREIPCRFYNGRGSFCWKGGHCPHLHVPGKTWKDFVNGPLDLGKEVVNTVMKMDAKKELVVESTLEVYVTHVISPTEFYVMPRDDRGCDCVGGRHIGDRMDKCRKKKLENCDEEIRKSIQFIQNKVKELSPPKEEDAADTADAYMGHGCYVKTLKMLNDVLDDNMSWRQRQSGNYAVGELVAVRVEGMKNKKLSWTRGEVLDGDVKEVGEREVPWFKVRLIDVGSCRTVPANELTKLPQEVAFTPCLVYKCSLINTDPIRRCWDTGATEMFRHLVESEVIQMEIKEGVDTGEHYHTVEFTPYQVDLKVLTEKGDFVHVDRIMKKAEMVLALNRFPYRPELNRLVGDGFWNLFFQNVVQLLSLETIETERKRLIAMRFSTLSDSDSVEDKFNELFDPEQSLELLGDVGMEEEAKANDDAANISDAAKENEAEAKGQVGDFGDVAQEKSEAEVKDNVGELSYAAKKEEDKAKDTVGELSDAAKKKEDEAKDTVGELSDAAQENGEAETEDTRTPEQIYEYLKKLLDDIKAKMIKLKS